MTDQQRADWFAGRWIAAMPWGATFWVARRQEKGIIEDRYSFPTEKKAQRYADKLNAQEASK